MKNLTIATLLFVTTVTLAQQAPQPLPANDQPPVNNTNPAPAQQSNTQEIAMPVQTNTPAGNQQTITVIVAPRATTKDTQMTYVVEIPQTFLKQVQKEWQKYLDKDSHGKFTVINGDNIQTGATNKNVSAYPFNVYSNLLETPMGVRITAWFTENNNIFMPEKGNHGQDLALQKYVRDFAIKAYQQAAQLALSNEQEKLKVLEKEQINRTNQVEKMTKRISENQRMIKKDSDAIATNNSDVLSSSDKINAQKGMVTATAADANATKGAKKTLGELEKDKKGMQKQNEKLGKDIDNRKKAIRDDERAITESNSNDASKTSLIEAQKLKVQAAQATLNNIK